MPGQGFQDLGSGSGSMAGDISPDSVIYTAESNPSVLSSGSDVQPDQDFITSAVYHHLAGIELSEVQSGPNPEPNKSTLIRRHKNGIIILNMKEKSQDSSESSEATEAESNGATDSSRSSFSQALKECQDRRLRSGVLSKKPHRQRPVSLDLNSTVSFGVMKKASSATCRIATFPSPGTPNHQDTNAATQIGWNSERFSLHCNANKRKVNTALLPYNNGRALPSKWEDAERWIFSPVSGDEAVRMSFQQPQRQAKSKSGPLGAPGVAHHQLFSPAEGLGNKLAANSSFSGVVMTEDRLSTQHQGCERSGNIVSMSRSVSIHGCSGTLSQSSLQDEKYGGTEDVVHSIPCPVSRMNRATQISPGSSKRASSRKLSSFSLDTLQSIEPINELQSMHSSKPKIRDVPVDERVTMTRWSKKNRGKTHASGDQNVGDWKRKAADGHHNWEASAETSKSTSNIQKEEAKISSWENLQRAKAETAIRKLEMKLEKKRSSSMDKIMNKLRSAQKKAQEMRSSMANSNTNQATHQTARPFPKSFSFRSTRQFGCFVCPAF